MDTVYACSGVRMGPSRRGRGEVDARLSTFVLSAFGLLMHDVDALVVERSLC